MTAEVIESWRGEGTLTSGDGVNFNADTSRFFTVSFSPNEYNAETLKTVPIPGLPAIRDPHPNNMFLRAGTKHVRVVSPIMAEVQITYGTTVGQPVGGDGNPLTKAADIEYDGDPVEEDFEFDINGAPLVTRLNERFEPPIKEQVDTPIIRIGKNLAAFDPFFYALYRNAVNSTQWYQFPAGTARMKRVRARSQTDQNIQFWRVEAEIWIRRGFPWTTDAKAWWRRMRAQGFYVNAPVALPGQIIPVRAIDKEGRPVVSPVLHDKETGFQLAAGAPAQWYEFETKPRQDFNLLNFP